MAEDDYNQKKTVAASDSIRSFLNMDGKPGQNKKSDSQNNQDEQTVPGDLPADLPFMETLEEPARNIQENSQPTPQIIPEETQGLPDSAQSDGPLTQIIGPASKKGHEAYAFVLWAAKNILPYIVIFAIGIGLYFFYFSDFSINSLFKSDALTIQNVDTTNKDLEKLKSDQKDAYLTWMKQFFFAVNDESIISMDTDVSGNGLTNFEKYLLNLNPKVYSSRGTNQPDGELVIENINPWTGKPFSDAQKALVDKYINKELISNRITAAALTRGITKFAQYVSTDSPYYVDPTTQQQIQQDNPTISSPENVSNQTAYQAAQQAGGSANLNPNSDVNQTVNAKLEIPANNISVPLIWTQNVSDFDKDLKNGVVHYPGTVLPGQIGTSYISGHSSGYIWDHSPYKQIFATLGNVKDGTSFSITVTQKDGKKVKYNYVVSGRGEYAANDQAQFVNTADSVVALSTCWPVGTTARRLVLYGKLTQTENI